MTLQNDEQPWYKQRWPWMLMAGPALVIVAGVVTVWLAIVSNDGLVSDDYYKQGLAVNQVLQRGEKAGSLGLQADVMRSGTNIRLLLRAEESMAMPEAIVLKLAYPTRSGFDQDVKMVSEGSGFYSGKLAGEVVGRWLVSLEDPNGNWRLQGEWQADSEGPLRLTAKAGK